MKFCSECGVEVSANSKFCPECGAPRDPDQAAKPKLISPEDCPHESVTTDSFTGGNYCPDCQHYVNRDTDEVKYLSVYGERNQTDGRELAKAFGILIKALLPILVGVGAYFYFTHHISSASSTNAPSSANAVAIGFPQEDGQLTFTVNSAPICGMIQIGSSGNYLPAQGQFCKINVTVSNHSNIASDFFESNQKLIDANGAQYDASGSASIYTGDTNFDISSINPGNSITGNLYFDIPKGITPIYLAVHDSAFSNGADIDLSAPPTATSTAAWFPNGYSELVTGLAWQWSKASCKTGEAYCTTVDVISQTSCHTLVLEINLIAPNKLTVVGKQTQTLSDVSALHRVTFDFASSSSQNAKEPYAQVASIVCA